MSLAEAGGPSGRAEPGGPVRWGILGTAHIARKAVIPAFRGSTQSSLLAIASRDGDKARAMATELGIPRAYGSYEELLSDPDVEVIYNPLPNHLHVPWSIRAVQAGKHVLCEKPIGLNAAEARELLMARDRSGVLVGEAFMVRCHPQWETVRKLISAGRIGALSLVVGHFSYGRREPHDVRSRLDYGGGALLDIGCYPVTLARWLFGAEPLWASALIDRDAGTGVDVLTSGVLRFPSGQASFTCGGETAVYQRIQAFGTMGRIDVPRPFTPGADHRCQILVDEGRPDGTGTETIEVPAANQYTLQADRFSAAVRGQGAVPVPLEDAIANMAVLDALFRSAETRRWESPD